MADQKFDFEPQFDFEPIKDSAPAKAESPKFYELEKQQGLPKTATDFVKQLGSRVLDEVTSPVPGVDPRGIALAASELANQAGNDVAKKTVPVIGKALGRTTGLASSMALDPASYLSGALTSAPAKSITNKIGEMAAEKLPGIFKFLAKVPEAATKTLVAEKGVLPEATAKAEEALTQKVQSVLENAVNDRGAELNKAKSAVGLPVTPEEKVAALKIHGNEFGVGQEEVKQIAQGFGDKYGPKTHLKQMLGDWAQKYLTNPEGAVKEISNTLEQNTNSGDKVGGWFPSTEIKDQFQKELMGKLDEFKSFVHFDEIKDPKQLAMAVDNFNQMADKIPEKARVKMATLLQDKINGMVDWQKSGTSLEGVLKQQYGQLGHAAIPEALQNSKSGMKEALDVMHDLGKKLGGDEGKAQQFLDKIFTNPTPANTDYIKKLGKLEAVSGQPILSDLYKHFASKSFGKNISRPVFEGVEGMYAGGKLLSGDLRGAAKILTLMGAQSPAVLKGLTRAGFKAADILPKAGLSLAAKTALNRSTALASSLKGVPLAETLSDKSAKALQDVLAQLKARPGLPSKKK